jgi:hypothetical protein
MDQPGTLSRRDVIQQVTALLGGAALAGGDGLLAFTFDADARVLAMAQGAGAFSAADVALLDEIAETILPETSTPGAKAAKTGAFMALMVTAAYSDRNRDIFRDGLRQVDERCRAAHGVPFMTASPAQRLVLCETLDREQRTVSEERAEPPRSRVPADEPVALSERERADVHYFRLIKELALQGYFTSEVGYTRAMRYVEAPGRFDPCTPHAPGDKNWASHA